MRRPIGVTILAVVAVLLAFLNAIVMVRFLGFLPFLGPINIRMKKNETGSKDETKKSKFVNQISVAV